MSSHDGSDMMNSPESVDCMKAQPGENNASGTIASGTSDSGNHRQIESLAHQKTSRFVRPSDGLAVDLISLRSAASLQSTPTGGASRDLRRSRGWSATPPAP